MADLDDLLNGVAVGDHSALYERFASWIQESRRFQAFVRTHQSKIRARLTAARNEDALQALWAELETAAVLLGDRRFTLEYEKYAATKQRGPDFTVTFKTHTPFNVEVRRLRTDKTTDASNSKLVSVICDKVGQMPPSIVNLLWLVCDNEVGETELLNAAQTLRQLAERKTEDFFRQYGFKNPREFLKHYRRLSAVMLWQTGKPILWLNPLAHHIVPTDIVKVLQHLVAS